MNKTKVIITGRISIDGVTGLYTGDNGKVWTEAEIKNLQGDSRSQDLFMKVIDIKDHNRGGTPL